MFLRKEEESVRLQSGCDPAPAPQCLPPEQHTAPLTRSCSCHCRAEAYDVWGLLGLLLLLQQSHGARRVSLELIFFRSCGSASPARQEHPSASVPHQPHTPRGPATSPWAPTASSSSFFIRRSVFILPEPFPWTVGQLPESL